MKILMANKYLYVVGGAEKYMFSLGDELKKQGHEVQYFGIASQKNIAGNDCNITAKCYENSLAQKMNLHSMVYSKSAKKSMDRLLDLYKPDIVHLNNINYQLTPSIIYSAKERNIPVIWTLHDCQLVCPSHRMYLEKQSKICTACFDGNFSNCIKNKCIGNSYIKSIIGCAESKRYHYKDHVYDYVSCFISPSKALADLVSPFIGKDKIQVIPNFSNIAEQTATKKGDYILYFGRLTKEKGILTLLKALPKDVKLVIAGSGPLEKAVLEASKANHIISFVGFKTGLELDTLISQAICTVYPSEWFENCPLSIIESIKCGTPVIGSNIGGIPELIEDGKTGLLFKPGDARDLSLKIQSLLYDTNIRQVIDEKIAKYHFVSSDEYGCKLNGIYENAIQSRSK
jgi:glycosyltransferase involved in cell wall biosynthesis